MTRRDLRWRAAGAALWLAGCAGAVVGSDGSPVILIYFLAAILGIVLMLQGKRVGIVWRAERRGHGETIAAVHAGRARRYRRED